MSRLQLLARAAALLWLVSAGLLAVSAVLFLEPVALGGRPPGLWRLVTGIGFLGGSALGFGFLAWRTRRAEVAGVWSSVTTLPMGILAGGFLGAVPSMFIPMASTVAAGFVSGMLSSARPVPRVGKATAGLRLTAALWAVSVLVMLAGLTDQAIGLGRAASFYRPRAVAFCSAALAVLPFGTFVAWLAVAAFRPLRGQRRALLWPAVGHVVVGLAAGTTLALQPFYRLSALELTAFFVCAASCLGGGILGLVEARRGRATHASGGASNARRSPYPRPEGVERYAFAVPDARGRRTLGVRRTRRPRYPSGGEISRSSTSRTALRSCSGVNGLSSSMLSRETPS